jgi:hypothetical protein
LSTFSTTNIDEPSVLFFIFGAILKGEGSFRQLSSVIGQLQQNTNGAVIGRSAPMKSVLVDGEYAPKKIMKPKYAAALAKIDNLKRDC